MFCWSQDERTHLSGGQGVGVDMAGRENSVPEVRGAGERGIFRGSNNNLNSVEPKS